VFGSSLPPVVCRRVHVLFTLLVCVKREVKTNQTHTNNVNKTRTILQTTGGKDEPNTVFMRNRNGLISTVKIGQCFIPTRHIWISKCTKKERKKNKDKNRNKLIVLK
jgi:hypothetical protein